VLADVPAARRRLPDAEVTESYMNADLLALTDREIRTHRPNVYSVLVL
jgi:hypothetical protein